VFRAEGSASAFLIGLVLVSCSPYAVAAVLALSRCGGTLGLGGAAASLLADVYTHYSVFGAPEGSTAALGLLVMPFWNLLAIGPAGAMTLWLGFKLLARRSNDVAPPTLPVKRHQRWGAEAKGAAGAEEAVAKSMEELRAERQKKTGRRTFE
jgi:hypothetical protein